MPEPNNDNVNERVKRLVETIDLANVLTVPLTRSIVRLLEVSAEEIESGEASVLVRDGEEGDLRFLCAIGAVAEQLTGMQVPAGKGIAGFVLSSGQPMAVADAGGEETFYAEVDKKTGYSTQTILATPLRFNGEVIGVLEYINRRGEPPFAPFTPEEMDRAANFAEAIASMVSAYESARVLCSLGDKIISDPEDYDFDAIRTWLGELRTSAEHREMMELAVLIRETASRGEAERTLCREILESVLKYSDNSADTSFLTL
ncbi:MAG TPA: GAF domain-containing protein [Pyrinomonadaceae bacterium]|jgi:signal transduction protein with GAF and PtsI domain|nr:GAF domain-containing protein [Pyrinomonadaceae bacterium]